MTLVIAVAVVLCIALVAESWRVFVGDYRITVLECQVIDVFLG